VDYFIQISFKYFLFPLITQTDGVLYFFREPHRGFTPFIEAAAAGHEIIVQYFLLRVRIGVYLVLM